MLGGLARIQSYFGAEALPGFHGRAVRGPPHYVAELLGLRGVGILIVLTGHFLERIDRFTSGHNLSPITEAIFHIFAKPLTGCALLFSISGYTLFLSFNSAKNSVDQNGFILHLYRRILRLWIPYAFVLVATFGFLNTTGYHPIGTQQFYVPPASLTISLISSLTLTHDITFGTFPRLFPPGWFIETMFQFYLIVPWILKIYLKVTKDNVRLLLGSLILLLTTVLKLVNFQYGPPQLQYSIIAFMPFFWTGVILADARRSCVDYPMVVNLQNKPYIGWLAMAALILLGASFGNEPLRLVAQMLCLILILTASSETGASFQRAMVARSLHRVGVASYAIFLVHLQILQIVVPFIIQRLQIENALTAILICGVLTAPVVMAVACGFYWFVERPFVAAATHLSLSRT